MTAKEFFQKYLVTETSATRFALGEHEKTICQMMNEFAKIKCADAFQAGSEYGTSWVGGSIDEISHQTHNVPDEIEWIEKNF